MEKENNNPLAQPGTDSKYGQELQDRMDSVLQSMERLASEIALFEGYPLWYRLFHHTKGRVLKESYDIAVQDKRLLEDQIREIQGFSDVTSA